MTYERVLEVFQDYLHEDKDSEVLSISRGYLVMYWESCNGGWVTARLAETPEDLRDILQERYEDFLCYQFSQDRERDPDAKERAAFKRMGAALAGRC